MSAIQREEQITEVLAQSWDLVIIGGGITGAGILLDAAARGLRPLLLEKNDFAWGTSSRSTKLIHGGLRYLKQMEISLVRSVGKERAIVYRNARHIVRPEKMLLPIIRNGSLGKTASSLGLWVYDWLAEVEKGERRVMLTKEQTLEMESKLNPEILLGGGLYYEYRTDDARLTIEVMKKAVELGARALNYCEVTEFAYQGKKLSGVKFADTLSGNTRTVASKCIVNATGPWVDEVRRIDEPEISGKTLRLTKGVHLVIPREKLDLTQSVYFDVPDDGRMIFCIPRDQVVYMGTTDTNYQENIDTPGTSTGDAAYILNAVNFMFPDAHVKAGDVISTWAGLRPLIHEEGKAPSELSRKDEIFISKSGLISIAGGKLTGYRKMAAQILKEIRKRNDFYKIENEIGPGKTKKIKVSGNPFDSEEEMNAFLQDLLSAFGDYPNEVKSLFRTYGANAAHILEQAEKWSKKRKAGFRDALVFAEVQYAIGHEMVHTLSDFCIRRTGMLYFEPDRMLGELALMATCMQEVLGWDDERKKAEIQSVKSEYRSALSFQKA